MSAGSPADTLIGRILDGQAPVHVRAAAARGAVPLPRADLVRLYVILLDDEEERVRRDAATSLGALEQQAVREILSDARCAPEVLSHFAKQAVRDAKLAELIVFHKQLPDQVLELFAARGNAAVVELVLTNQEKLLSQPGLLDKLTVNPALRADQQGRIMELLDRASKMIRPGEAEESASQATAEEAARLLDVDVGDLYAVSEIVNGEEFEQHEDVVVRSAYKKIVTLNTAQKAILAMKGGREECMILVRDTNRIVALSSLRNPRLKDDDVERIAMMRNISDEVLRRIGARREWIKNYSVVTALVHNPKTPPGIATNFIPRLMTRDLKNLSKDHNVPEIIRKMAKRTFDKRKQQKTAASKRR